jgi:hypothetical protein
MTYRIEGLAPAAFEGLFGMTDDELAARNAVRVTAESAFGYPCRVSLRDADEGDELVLLNHVSHDVQTPFRTSYGIFVSKGAATAAYADEIPEMLNARTLGLRGFDEKGMLRDGLLALPGEADSKIRELFDRDEVATIHAHSAAYGCFLARIERN